MSASDPMDRIAALESLARKLLKAIEPFETNIDMVFDDQIATLRAAAQEARAALSGGTSCSDR